MADLEFGVANSPSSVFEGGSVAKQFTSAAIVLLALDGALSLDDDVRDHVPELPNYGHRITLHNLMTHTSGLRDWGSVATIAGWGRELRSHDHEWVLDILSRQRHLNFPPGHQYSYSNSGYNLLAIIVERASGISFAEFSRERIFEPLGLTSTQWRDNYRRLVPGRSTAYRTGLGGEWMIGRPIEFVHGNGGILTTVADLIAWTHAVATGDGLGGSAFVEMMHERGTLSDGSRIPYAGGLVHGELGGVRSVSHTGSTAGYRAYLGRFPDHGLTVAMLCNASNVPTSGTGTAIARVALGDAVQEASVPEHDPVDPELLTRLAGLYRNPVSGNTKRLTVFHGTLRESGVFLAPLSESRFRVGAGDRHYDFIEGNGDRPWIKVDSWEFTDERFEPVEPWEPDASALAEFEGRYVSDEAETIFDVRLGDGSLTITQRPGRVRPLTPIYADGFRTVGGIVRFRRDEAGQVTALSLSVSRVFDMRFERVTGDVSLPR